MSKRKASEVESTSTVRVTNPKYSEEATRKLFKLLTPPTEAQVAELLKEGADPNGKKLLHSEASGFSDEDKFVTPLYRAAEHDDGKICKTLLKAGADPNVRNATYWYPLHVAARFGNYAAAEELIKKGADITKTDEYHKDTPADVANKNWYHVLAEKIKSKFTSTHKYSKEQPAK